MPIERQEALRAVVSLSHPFEEALRRLRSFEYTWSQPSRVELTCADVVAVLERYIAGSVDAVDVERWAEAIVGREDLEFAPGDEDALQGVLFRLSTPEITESLTRETAVSIVNELQVPRTAV